MQSNQPLRIAGVPEAYNEPFHLLPTSHWSGTPPQFISHPGGSGSMLNALLSNTIDVAFALTDCIVAYIENGKPIRIAAPLVHTPLTWAVIVSPDGVKQLSELADATWGVSRMGSGSHVMVQTMAKKNAWAAPKFKVCGDFAGLRGALANGEIDAFLWEMYTTKPYAESGVVRIIGGVPTPWGCFSVAVRADCARMSDVHSVVDLFLAAAKSYIEDEASVEIIANKYNMTPHDATMWMSGVKYALPGERQLSSDVLQLTRQTLLDAGVIERFAHEGDIQSYHI